MRLERVRRWFGIEELKDGTSKLPEEDTIIGVKFGSITDPVEQVHEMRNTPPFKELKGKRRFTPYLPHNKKTWIVVSLCTIAAASAGYKGYKLFKEHSKHRNLP